jgi:hypothetical protein
VITDVNASGIPVVSIDLPRACRPACDPIGESIGGTTVTLGAPKLPVLPPAQRPWDIVIADIGIPSEYRLTGRPRSIY